jgi:hypothetical protein
MVRLVSLLAACCFMLWTGGIQQATPLTPNAPYTIPDAGEFRSRVAGQGRGSGASVRRPLAPPTSLKGLPVGWYACFRAVLLGSVA